MKTINRRPMTSTVRPKADRRKKSVPNAEAMAIAGQVAPGDIARRAFELYCARGGQHGSDVEDWLRAERELSTSPASPAEPRRRTTRKTAPLD
jgi:Protein of unknown function (DUF2934)